MSDTLITTSDPRLPGRPNRRLVIVVRADPVICGHSGEARNLAETAIDEGYDDVRIVTWPIGTLQAAGLPLKPLDAVLPYSEGITVERPEPIGDYKVPDGRVQAAIVGRLVELFTDGVPTVCMSLYLMPHALAVAEATATARSLGLPTNVTTIAEAVGSDITNVVRSCVESGRLGAAAHLFSTYLGNDHPIAVSEYTKTLIVEAAAEVDHHMGTTFEAQCAERIEISYPAIDAAGLIDIDKRETDRALARRGLTRNGYVLFLSRITPAKGVDDLIDGFAMSQASRTTKLVIAGTGPALATMKARAAEMAIGDQIIFFDDVGDEEKTHLMAGCAAYALPSKPRPEFIETFGIALVEKMLAGGGPVITTPTGGIPEAVGDAAIMVPAGAPGPLSMAIDRAVLDMTPAERSEHADRARTHALQFDRSVVFDRLFSRVSVTV